MTVSRIEDDLRVNTLEVSSVNGIVYASTQTGSDAGVKIASAVALLPASGGTVDATGLSGAQSAASTITINKPVRLLLGAITLTLSGNPGINITSEGVSIIGQGGQNFASYTADINPTILRSGAAFKLINDSTSLADGLQVINCELDGNSIGAYGVYYTQATALFSNLSVHGFTTLGIYASGGLNSLVNSGVWGNAEGAQWGNDNYNFIGNSFDKNTGIGLHIISGGGRYISTEASFNGSYGIFVDGTSASVAFVEIVSPYVDDNNTDNIRIEGGAVLTTNVQDVKVLGGYIAQAGNSGNDATGIHVKNANSVILEAVNWQGGVQNQGLDTGGIVIEGSAFVVVNDFYSSNSTQNAIRVLSSSNIKISNPHIFDTAISTTTTANSYGISLDSLSVNTIIHNSSIVDGRTGPGPYSRGISNAGSGTVITGYTQAGLHALPDTFGFAVGWYINPINSQPTFFNGLESLGSINLYNGFAIFGYSDAGSTQKFKADAFSGDLTLAGDVILSSGEAITWNADTGVSRDSAGVIDIGNGTPGDISGAIQAALQSPFSVSLTGQTGTITATNLVASPTTTSLYEIRYYLNDTTAGTSGTVSVTISWNDGAAQSVTSSNVTFGVLGAYVSGVIVVKATSGAIKYATTVTSAVGGPAYSLDLRVTELR